MQLLILLLGFCAYEAYGACASNTDASKSLQGTARYFLVKTTAGNKLQCAFVDPPKGGTYTYGGRAGSTMVTFTATFSASGDKIGVSGGQGDVNGQSTLLHSDYNTCDVVRSPTENCELYVRKDKVGGGYDACCTTKYDECASSKGGKSTELYKAVCPAE
uniref:Salivary lipocalin n=1 Tax=Ornithodoros coriaceus TaxID=92741 RepID=B2D292_ORNCO|nr:salivary lipocalin [Ornithodoros coriaceus]